MKPDRLIPALLTCCLAISVACAGTGAPSTAPDAAPDIAEADAEPSEAPDAPDAAEAAEAAGSDAADADEEPEYFNTIRWQTASEVDNFGFDVYRGDSEDGPFTLLTEQPIEGAGTIDEPQTYKYVDSEIDPARAYYYYVESISMSGVRERFTPVVRAKPKLLAEDR